MFQIRQVVATARLSMVALLAATSLSTPASAQSSNCENPQAACGAALEQECLTRVGAGVLPVGDASGDDCDQQLSAYRACLARVVSECPAAREPEVDAAAGAALEELGRLGGLIETPETAVEFYNNALVYGRRGDLLSARRMFERAIVQGVDAVDMHQRYSQLLKAQEGLIGAREVYGDLVRRQPDNNAAALANAVLQPANAREAALRALVDGDAPFAPAYFVIAALFSADRLGEQSIEDKRAEKAALDAFAAADEAGKVYRWFLQKETVEIWRESVRRRLAAYSRQALDVDPVQFSVLVGGNSWTVTLQLLETATEIRYRIDGGEARSTGATSIVDQRTGKPFPNPTLSLPLDTVSAMIEVFYDDIGGVERGPFVYAFDRQAAFINAAKERLRAHLNTWVHHWQFDVDRHLVYFTAVLGHRCGLSEVAYGVDRNTPDQTLRFGPCDPLQPYVHSDDDEILELGAVKPERIAVQLTYADGEKGPVRVFGFADRERSDGTPIEQP